MISSCALAGDSAVAGNQIAQRPFASRTALHEGDTAEKVNSHMNPASTAASNTTFGATDRGGQLMINYWTPGASSGTSVPAISRSVNVATLARWYLNFGF